MGIQRVPEVPFAQIANEALRDKRLSFKARGILALVLSHSGEWNATKRWLSMQSEKDGRSSIQSALNELTELGYREVIKERINGEIRTVVQWKHRAKVSISRRTENLIVGETDGQETESSIEHNSSEHNLVEEQVLFPESVAAAPPVWGDTGRAQRPSRKRLTGASVAEFEAFWQAYPRKAAKGAARNAWLSAREKATMEIIMNGVYRYRDDPNRDDAFTAYASTWLNQERWEDDPIPGRKGKQTAGDARMQSYQEMYNALEIKREIEQ